jgi:hypothetical protein
MIQFYIPWEEEGGNDEIIDYERDFKKAQKGDSEQVNTKGYEIFHSKSDYKFCSQFIHLPLIVFEKWTLTKNLTDPDADARVTTIARLFFFEKSS